MNFITTPEHFKSVLITYLNSLGRGPAYYDKINNQRANKQTFSSFPFLFSFMVQDSTKVGFTLIGGSSPSLVDFGGSLQYQNSVQKEQASVIRYAKNINDFYGWLVLNDFDINYQKIIETMIPFITAELFTSFPYLGRVMRGLEVYPLKKPQSGDTLAVSKYKKQGVERPYMVYNPKFIIDTIIADILADKYIPSEIMLIVRYLFVHELYHVAKSQLSDWTQERVKYLNPGVVNIMMDLGINTTICRVGKQEVVDSAISPGIYFDYIVKDKDKTISGMASLVKSYSNGGLADSVDDILDDLKNNDSFRLTMGRQLEDISEFMFQLNRLVGSGAITLKVSSRDELKKSLTDAASDKPKPDLINFSTGDIVVDMGDFTIYIVIMSDGKKSKVQYLGKLFSLKDVYVLKETISSLKSTSRLVEVSNQRLLLTDIDMLTVSNLVRVGDIVLINNNEYGKCIKITPDGLSVETVDIGTMNPEQIYLSLPDLIARITAKSSVKQRGVNLLVDEEVNVPIVADVIETETHVEEVEEPVSINYKQLASRILNLKL